MFTQALGGRGQPRLRLEIGQSKRAAHHAEVHIHLPARLVFSGSFGQGDSVQSAGLATKRVPSAVIERQAADHQGILARRFDPHRANAPVGLRVLKRAHPNGSQVGSSRAASGDGSLEISPLGWHCAEDQ